MQTPIHNNQKKRVPVFLPPLGGNKENFAHSLRYRIVVLVIVNIAALATFSFLFGFILNKKDVIVEAVSKLDVEQLKEQQLYALRDSFRETEKERAALTRYFLNPDELVAFIEDIEQAGRQANVFLQFRFVNIRDAEGELALEFETLGSFNETFHFLRLIESVPITISLEKFVLSTDIPRALSQRKESDTWHSVFTLVVLGVDL